MLMHMISLHQCGLELDCTDFNNKMLTSWCEYISEEYSIECETPKDPPKLKNLEVWLTSRKPSMLGHLTSKATPWTPHWQISFVTNT